jgi:hypothetical protein
MWEPIHRRWVLASPLSKTRPIAIPVKPGYTYFVLDVVGGMAWGMLRLTLNRQVPAALAGHEEVVQLPARVAHISITLP